MLNEWRVPIGADRSLVEGEGRPARETPRGFIKDPTGVAALCLGKQEAKELRYMGKVGTGWSRTTSAKIRKALDTVVSPKHKLSKPIKRPKASQSSMLTSSIGTHVGRAFARQLI
jgi:hypothetical protein